MQAHQLLYNYDAVQVCNAVLAGLVSVTASSYNIELWAAACIGMIGSVIYNQSRKMIIRYEIDDPLDVTEVHGACGFWSVIALGLFDIDQGMLYTGDATQLGIQFIGAMSYTIWTLLLSFMFFHALKKNDRLRVDFIYEIIGLDFVKDLYEGSIHMSSIWEEERRELLRQQMIERRVSDKLNRKKNQDY